MPTARFVNATHDIKVNTVPKTLERGTHNCDDEEYPFEEVGGVTPNLRNGISKEGKVRVIVNEEGSHKHSLAVLLGLHSPVGPEGDYTVYVNDVAHAYHALIEASMDGEFVQFVTLEWKGTIQA